VWVTHPFHHMPQRRTDVDASREDRYVRHLPGPWHWVKGVADVALGP